MTPQPIFIGVAWPYVNGDPHIGHLAGYLLPADVCARFHRLRGHEVLMVSGSDCYGTPITVEADKRGVNPAKIVAEYHARDVALFQKLGISYDLYTQTTTENHHQVTQDIFLTCLRKGYITKQTTDQYYDAKHQRFLPDRYVEGTCPFCGDTQARSDQCDVCGNVLEQGQLIEPKSKLTSAPVTLKPTEHYFFDWTKADQFLREYLAKQTDWKDWVHAEASRWLERGLKPRAITRDLDWGVPLPVDQIPEAQRIEGIHEKRIYVWFEAVIGYLSASKEWASKTGAKDSKGWEHFWQNPDAKHFYFMGKDNLIFHTLFWPGQLHAYDESLNLPNFPAINQFLTLEGKKFSKSKGVIVDSEYITSTYGIDPVRFYLLSIAPENADANFSWADFIHKHNDVLIGTLGNYVQRVLTLGQGVELDPTGLSTEMQTAVGHALATATAALAHCQLKTTIDTVLDLADVGNKYLSKETPWVVRKTDSAKFAAIMSNAMLVVLALGVVLQPLLPTTAANLWQQLGLTPPAWGDDLLSQLQAALSAVHLKQRPRALFAPIDVAAIEAEAAKVGAPI